MLPPPQRRRQTAANIVLSRCRHHLTAAKLPLTLRFCAATTATAAALLPLRCHCCAVRRPAAAKLPQTSRCRAAATAAAAATAPPFVVWLLRCCPPSNFVIAVMQPSMLSLPAAFADKLSSTSSTAAAAATAATAATAAAAGPPQPPPPPPWSNSPSYIGEERGSSTTTTCRTIVNTFTSPDNLDLFNLSTVFEV
jgi:hypothetical protein